MNAANIEKIPMVELGTGSLMYFLLAIVAIILAERGKES